jgi:hypothetical protein
MDNAKHNDTFMEELQKLLDARDIAFDAVDRRIMCFGHVVDLTSGRVIRGVSAGTNDDADWSGPPLPNIPSSQTYEQAIERDPIALGRTVVRVIRASGARREAFDDVIVNGNAKGWFKNGDSPLPTIVKERQLLRSVRTRWDSVYHMLNRLREMRPVRIYCDQQFPLLLIGQLNRQ